MFKWNINERNNDFYCSLYKYNFVRINIIHMIIWKKRNYWWGKITNKWVVSKIDKNIIKIKETKDLLLTFSNKLTIKYLNSDIFKNENEDKNILKII